MGRNKRLSAVGSVRAALIGLCLLLTGAAYSLDFNDVLNLLQHQVPESTIISMVQQDPNLTITPEQGDQLRAYGASENLIASIRLAPGYAAPDTVYPAPTYPADAGVVTTAPYTDYDYYDSDYDDFESEYYQQPGTTYVDPTIVYPAPPVIYEPPSVIYEQPTVVYPSGPAFDFNIFFGGNRWDDRWDRPRPPSHRPPPPPPHRPGGGHDRPGYDRPGHDRPGQGGPGHDRPGQGKPGNDRPGQGKPGNDRPGQGGSGHDRPGQGGPGPGGKPNQGGGGQYRPDNSGSGGHGGPGGPEKPPAQRPHRR